MASRLRHACHAVVLIGLVGWLQRIRARFATTTTPGAIEFGRRTGVFTTLSLKSSFWQLPAAPLDRPGLRPPSTVSSAESSRKPKTRGAEAPPSNPGVVAPTSPMASFTGNCSIRARSSRSLMVGVEKSIMGVTSPTVTCVAVAPTFIETSTEAARPAWSTILPSHVSMPGAATVSL